MLKKRDQNVRVIAQRETPKGGYTIRGFAAAADLPEGRVRRAVKYNDIDIIKFGGVVRIPSRELEKVRELYK